MSFKIKEATSKIVPIVEKKVRQYFRQIEYTSPVQFPTKLVPDANFIDEPVVQYDVLVVGNTFPNECK